jgi:hypothetical protein
MPNLNTSTVTLLNETKVLASKTLLESVLGVNSGMTLMRVEKLIPRVGRLTPNTPIPRKDMTTAVARNLSKPLGFNLVVLEEIKVTFLLNIYSILLKKILLDSIEIRYAVGIQGVEKVL